MHLINRTDLTGFKAFEKIERFEEFGLFPNYSCAAVMRMSTESIARKHMERGQGDSSTFANGLKLCLASWERNWFGKLYGSKHRGSD